jgi:hypothetical protein
MLSPHHHVSGKPRHGTVDQHGWHRVLQQRVEGVCLAAGRGNNHAVNPGRDHQLHVRPFLGDTLISVAENHLETAGIRHIFNTATDRGVEAIDDLGD